MSLDALEKFARRYKNDLNGDADRDAVPLYRFAAAPMFRDLLLILKAQQARIEELENRVGPYDGEDE